MAKWLSIPIISLYVIGATILFQYGYNSYFNIPYEYIGASTINYTLFSYSIFNLALAVVKAIAWWEWLLIIVGFLVAAFFYVFSRFWRIVISLAFGALLVWLLVSCVQFGEFIARHQTNFLVLSASCPPVGESKSYVIPMISNNQAILVPIDENRKMQGSFLVKDVSQLGCNIEHKEVGAVTK